MARIQGSQRIMSNAQADLHKLKGLVPVVEDWHAKLAFLGASPKIHAFALVNI